MISWSRRDCSTRKRIGKRDSTCALSRTSKSAFNRPDMDDLLTGSSFDNNGVGKAADGRGRPPAVEILSAEKIFADGTRALAPIDLTIGDGEFLTLIGP